MGGLTAPGPSEESDGACPDGDGKGEDGSSSSAASESSDDEASKVEESFFSVRSKGTFAELSEQDVVAQRCEAFASEHLRQRPTLPACAADPSVSWDEVDSGVRLPLFSCPFSGCRYHTDDRVAFLKHLGSSRGTSPHADVIGRICGVDMQWMTR